MSPAIQQGFRLLGWGLDDFISHIERMDDPTLEEMRRELVIPEAEVPERHRFMVDAGLKCVLFEQQRRAG